MNAKKIIEAIPRRRFATVYENNSLKLKEYFLQVIEGRGDEKTYQFIIDNVEHQDTLWRISPWALKLLIALLEEEKTDKKQLLNFISLIYSGANFQIQSQRLNYKPSKGMLEKYSKIKGELFDDENTDEFWEIYKSLHRYFINVIVLEYISHYKPFFERFTKSNEPEITGAGQSLIESINNPKQYFN